MPTSPATPPAASAPRRSSLFGPRPATPDYSALSADQRRSAKQRDLEALRACHAEQSPLLKSIPGWTKIVFGAGDPDAAVMFIGEAPGADEDRTGIPFVGRAGQKLSEMIKAMGLTRDDAGPHAGPRGVYIANVLKVRPPDNRTPTPDEAAAEGPFLAAQIATIQPLVICSLGKPAANFLLGNAESMTALRGRWFTYTLDDGRAIPLMPTFHPAYLLRAYTEENRKKVWSDLKQVMAKLAELSPEG
ncbi:MAG: uracil-DNA glycosylase [Phycisphaerales bacterium]|nr:uracil-DNA glycosylase [Phycisphaerales bacterium]